MAGASTYEGGFAGAVKNCIFLRVDDRAFVVFRFALAVIGGVDPERDGGNEAGIGEQPEYKFLDSHGRLGKSMIVCSKSLSSVLQRCPVQYV